MSPVKDVQTANDTAIVKLINKRSEERDKR